MDHDELERCLQILKEELKAGGLHIREGMQVIDSLKRVRYGADGRVDDSTVDGLVRALALGVAHERTRREMKSMPLRSIQEAYFAFLERHFGRLFSDVHKSQLTLHQAAVVYSNDPTRAQKLYAQRGEIASALSEFWSTAEPVVNAHLEEMNTLKAVFGGDIFPSYLSNIASSVGLYMDTIVLPDPLVRVVISADAVDAKTFAYQLVKHSLNALNYKDLALMDVDPPIVVIAADPFFLHEYERKLIRHIGEADLLMHCGHVFGRRFHDVHELKRVWSQIDTPAKIVASVSDQRRLLFDIERTDSLAEQLNTWPADMKRITGYTSPPNMKLGDSVGFMLMGRMMQIGEVVLKSQRLHGSPLIDAPTSWQYLLWKYEYDQARSANETLTNVAIAHALQVAGSNDYGLLSQVPPRALVTLRKQGALAELREKFRKGIDSIRVETSAEGIQKVTEAVSRNLEEALEKHSEELKNIARDKRRFYGFEIARWIGLGGFSLAAAMTGNQGLAVAAASSALVGAKGVPELIEQGKAIHTRNVQLKQSAVGILARHIPRRQRRR